VKTPSFSLDVFDKKGNFLGIKEISDNRDYLNGWFKRPKCDVPAIPLTSALNVQGGNVRLDRTAAGGFGYAFTTGNDPQQSGGVHYLSGVSSNSNGSAITPSTFNQVMVQVAVRKVIPPTWTNDRDQYQVPFCDRATYKQNQEPGNTNLPQEFIADCVVYNLFAGHNQTSTLTGTYKGNPFTLDNQFFPYSKSDVANWAKSNLSIYQQANRADETFTHNWLKAQDLSPEAIALIDAARAVYALFYSNLNNLMQAKYSLQSWNPGWYQVRKSLEEAELGSIELEAVKAAHQALASKIKPQVYSLGFLPEERFRD